MEMGIVEIVLSVVGSLGGVELVRWWYTRKSSRRLADFEVIERTMVFLQNQLDEKERRFVEQTGLVRKLNAENLDFMKRIGELERELLVKRCDRLHCGKRVPPTVFTGQGTDEPQSNK